MVTKADLYRLIDALPEAELPVAERFLTALEVDAAAPHTPPELAETDDEPLTAEDEADLAEARAELARGEGLTTEQVRRALGL
jgi:hypothetical protein